MNVESNSPENNRRRGPGIISFLFAFLGTALAAVLALITAFLQVKAGFAPDGGEGGYLVGRTVGGVFIGMIIAGFLGVVVGAIAAMLKGSFLKGAVRTYAVAIVFVALVMTFGGLLRMGGSVSSDREILAEMQGELDRLAEARKVANDTGEQIDIQFDSSRPASTEMGKLRNAFLEFLDRSISVENTHQGGLKELGMDHFLSPSSLESDTDFQQSHTTLNRAKESAETFRTETESAMNELASKVDQLQFQGKESRQFAAEFKAGMGDYFRDTHEVLDLETKKMFHFEEALEFLEGRKDQWHIGEDKILFHSDELVAKYSNIIEEINKCANRQNEIRRPERDPGA